MNMRPLLLGLGVAALAAPLRLPVGRRRWRHGSVDVSNEAYGLSVRLASTIGQCWFAPGQTMFAGYVYSPERNADVSRIMIVKKDNPTGLPAMVVQPTSGTSATIYGPLAETANGPRIRADVDRWAKGGTSCT